MNHYSSPQQSSSPFFSIVIPTYNRADLIHQTLDSVQQQSFPDWQCLVVDDGSTDNSARLAQDFASRDPHQRFHVLRKENSGVAATRNLGVRHARGRYLIFLDSDDLFLPGYLAGAAEFLTSRPDLDFAWCASHSFRHPDPDDIISTADHHPRDFLLAQLRRSMCGTATVSWRRGFFLQLDGFDERLRGTEDWEFVIRALLHGARYDKMNFVGAAIRMHPGHRLTDINQKRADLIFHTVDIVVEHLDAAGKYCPPYTDALARFLLTYHRMFHQANLKSATRECMRRVLNLPVSPRTRLFAQGYHRIVNLLGARLTESLFKTAHRSLTSLGLVHKVSPWLHDKNGRINIWS